MHIAHNTFIHVARREQHKQLIDKHRMSIEQHNYFLQVLRSLIYSPPTFHPPPQFPWCIRQANSQNACAWLTFSPLTSYGKRESCISSATTTTLLGPPTGTVSWSAQRGSNGTLQMYTMPRAISPLMQVSEFLFHSVWHFEEARCGQAFNRITNIYPNWTLFISLAHSRNAARTGGKRGVNCDATVCNFGITIFASAKL